LRDTERQAAKQGDSILPPRRTAQEALLAGKLPFARLCQQLGFQMLRRATFEQFQLAHAIDTIARIDAAARASHSPGSSRPNILGKTKSRGLGQ
jgi:hypothetical protein